MLSLRYLSEEARHAPRRWRTSPPYDGLDRELPDGAPMEQAVEQHLFEPFFSSESRSSGLGLYICRELCERHRAVIGYQRVTREREGRVVQGNEFFVNFRPPKPSAVTGDLFAPRLV